MNKTILSIITFLLGATFMTVSCNDNRKNTDKLYTNDSTIVTDGTTPPVPDSALKISSLDTLRKINRLLNQVVDSNNIMILDINRQLLNEKVDSIRTFLNKTKLSLVTCNGNVIAKKTQCNSRALAISAAEIEPLVTLLRNQKDKLALLASRLENTVSLLKIADALISSAIGTILIKDAPIPLN